MIFGYNLRKLNIERARAVQKKSRKNINGGEKSAAASYYFFSNDSVDEADIFDTVRNRP